jgi:hypothetical protein
LINIPETMSLSRQEQSRSSRHSSCDDEIAKGENVPKPDSSAGFRFAMLDTGQPKQRVEDGVLPRPNPVFVTHLIATAAQVPQTRPWCRATAADAQSAYRTRPRPVQAAGIRTRQII